MWPLPPPGPLSFVCEWPAAEIPLTRSDIDAQTILDTVDRVQIIFPDQQSAQNSTGSGWTSSTIQSTASKPKPKPKPQPHSE